jgi:hypothetical protein
MPATPQVPKPQLDTSAVKVVVDHKGGGEIRLPLITLPHPLLIELIDTWRAVPDGVLGLAINEAPQELIILLEEIETAGPAVDWLLIGDVDNRSGLDQFCDRADELLSDQADAKSAVLGVLERVTPP